MVIRSGRSCMFEVHCGITFIDEYGASITGVIDMLSSDL